MANHPTASAADTIQWGNQTGIVFYPRPFLKTEQILVDQQQPPVKIEPADNEEVKCEVNSGFIKCEQEVACKEDPDLVESVHIKSLSDCGPVKTEPAEFSSFLDNSDTPTSTPATAAASMTAVTQTTPITPTPAVFPAAATIAPPSRKKNMVRSIIVIGQCLQKSDPYHFIGGDAAKLGI
eukprot:sb/3471713/